MPEKCHSTQTSSVHCWHLSSPVTSSQRPEDTSYRVWRTDYGTTRAKKSLSSRFLQYSLTILGAREAEDHPLCFSLRIGVTLNTSPMSHAPPTWHFPTVMSPSLSTLLCHFKANLLFFYFVLKTHYPFRFCDPKHVPPRQLLGISTPLFL